MVHGNLTSCYVPNFDAVLALRPFDQLISKALSTSFHSPLAATAFDVPLPLRRESLSGATSRVISAWGKQYGQQHVFGKYKGSLHGD